MSRRRAWNSAWTVTILIAVLISSAALQTGTGHAAAVVNGRIAFASAVDGDYDIYTVAQDGSGLTRLTDNTATDRSPAWSPDGTWILFESDRTTDSPEGDFELYVMAADGTGLVRLTNNDVDDRYASWSPDGNAIVFERTLREPIGTGKNAHLDKEIFTAVVTPDGLDGSPTNISNDPAWDRTPVWAPDGQSIAFASDRDSSFLELYRMRPDGSDVQRLTENQQHDWLPDWSTDGTRLAFVRDAKKGRVNYDIHLIDLETGTETPLITSPSFDIHPDWSPDGERIVFSADGVIHVVGADGEGTAEPLTDEGGRPVNGTQPDWQAIQDCPFLICL